MKKILTRIFSVALAATLALPASAAAPQLATKAKSPSALSEQRSVLQKALPENMLKAKGITPLNTRSAAAKADAVKTVKKIPSKSASNKPVKIMKEAGEMPDLIGNLIYSDNSTLTTGLYTVPQNATAEPNLLIDGVNAKNGGVIKEQTYYATYYFDLLGYVFVYTEAYDLETNTHLYEVSPDIDAILFAATYDPTTDKIYSIGYNNQGNGLQFGTIEYSENAVTVTPISEWTYNVNCLACDSEGQLYAILYNVSDETVSASFLCKIDKTTGEVTQVGVTGELPEYLSGGVIDPKTNTFYWHVCPADETGWMTTVDLTTGAATRIYQLANNEEFVGIQIRNPLAEEKAPAAPTDLALNFVDGSLSGTVNFTIPATLFDGSAATGDVTYTILANGEELAKTTAAVGTDVAANVEFDAPGNYEFVVYTTNSVGDSPKARITKYIGNGVPKATKPTLAYADLTFTLTWDAVTESADGGYLDAAAVTYTVKDLISNEIVAENIAATEWTTTIEAEPTTVTSYQYSVTVTCNELSSAATSSNSISLGYILPPYENPIANADDFDQFTVIDVNGDNKSWTLNGNAARIAYNTSLDMDDWLISAPIKMEANKAYYISFDIKAQSASYPEQFEICAGSAATAEAMTTVIVEKTEVTSTAYETYGGYFTAEADGKYYIGLHGCSEKDKYYLYAKNFSVSAGISANAPGKVTDLIVAPATYGALFTSVSFNAPAKTLGGAELTEITKIEISRDEEVIAVKENVTPGAAIKVADALDMPGNYTYSVVAYNSEGVGEASSATVYVGVAAPTDVPEVTVTGVGNNITLSWTAPSTDVNGNSIAPDQVTYNIRLEDNSGQNIIAENVTGTTYEYTYTTESELQQFLFFSVQSATEAGTSEYFTQGIPYAAGPAYEGFAFSMPDGLFGNYIFYSMSTGAAWLRCSDDGANNSTYFNNVTSYDGDNGFIAMKGSNIGQSASLTTGAISLENIENPGLTFAIYVIAPDDTNEFTMSVSPANANDWKVVKSGATSEYGEGGWVKIQVPLTEYAGQVIQLRIGGTIQKYQYMIFDAIYIGQILHYDLVAKSISAPAKVAAGDDYAVTVTVANNGTEASTASTVELYALTEAGFEVVDTKPLDAIEPDATASVEFTRTVSPLATAEDSVDYYAKVVFEADEDDTNNTTEAITVKPIVSNLPAATELKGEATEAGNVLTWNEPDLTAGVPDATTDDFEDAESFAKEYKDWIFVDVDQSAVGGFQNTDLPGIEPGETLASWFVFDASGEQFNATFGAASGDKYLACLFRYDDGTVDDWAISPALNGCAQTISFKAKSYSTQYPDAFEIWISTGSTDVNDFTKLSEKEEVNTNNWTDYSFDLPEGTKRFAIRSCATGSFMLMLDDVTYIPGDAVADLTLVGYDIYRNGEKINAEVVAETTYTDTEAAAGEKVTYNVVAIYTTGASAPSNTLELTTSALDSIFGGINIAAAKGQVVITGAEGLAVQVVAIDGKVLFSGIAEDKTTVDVLPGVYVVKAGDKIAKLLVR